MRKPLTGCASPAPNAMRCPHDAPSCLRPAPALPRNAQSAGPKLEAAQSGAADFERRLAQASRRVDELETQVKTAAAALAAAEEAAQTLAKEAEDLRAQISEAEQNAAETSERIVAKRLELTAAEQRRESLLRMERLLEGYSDGVKRVLNDASGGRLSIACYGTVSQLDRLGQPVRRRAGNGARSGGAVPRCGD